MRIDNATATSGQAMYLNQWNHVVATFGQSGTAPTQWLNVFQNDQKTCWAEGSNSGNSNIVPSLQHVRIGAGAGINDSNTSPPNPLQGQIDEIVIFNTVMPDYSNPVADDVDKLYLVGQAARQ
jgi:hypothetical protein